MIVDPGSDVPVTTGSDDLTGFIVGAAGAEVSGAVYVTVLSV
jgi:hypothetical protein